MKKGILGVLSFVVVLIFSTYLQAASLIYELALPQGSILNLIDWSVGDKATYDIDLGFLGKGSVVKEATEEEGNALWIVTDAKTPMGAQKAEALISREDGTILKLIVDGKEQEVPESNFEIISKEAAEVTVPAGTFKTIHVKLKDKSDDSEMEAWVNPKDIPLGGIVKNVTAKGFLTVTLLLKSFSFAESQISL
jgi:hypothetical protein